MQPFVQQIAQVIINDRSFYDLPRKFNIAYDGGGLISSVEDTNDIGVKAVKADLQIDEKKSTAPSRSGDRRSDAVPRGTTRLGDGAILCSRSGCVVRQQRSPRSSPRWCGFISSTAVARTASARASNICSKRCRSTNISRSSKEAGHVAAPRPL